MAINSRATCGSDVNLLPVLMSEKLVKRHKVAVLGPLGTYSHEASPVLSGRGTYL